MTKSAKGRDGPIAQRLRRLRAVIEPGMPASEFARKYGFTESQWWNFENGYPLPSTSALRLRQRIPGLTLDWLYLGETGGLTVALANTLEKGGSIRWGLGKV